MKRPGLFILILVLGTGSAQALAPGDGVVVLDKDGSKVSGVLVEETPTQVTVDVGGARMTSNRGDIRSVTAKKTSVQRFREMLKAAGNDPRKLRAAADFARTRHLYTDYEALAKRLGLPADDTAPPVPAGSADAPPPAPVPAPAAAQQPPPIDSAVQGAPAQTLGFASNNNALEIVSADELDSAPAPRQERERRDNDADFLKRQAAERDARTHQVTNPTSDMQFKLQQALDRQARGLPFGAP